MTKAHIQEKSESFVIRYPEIDEFMEQQLDIFWTAKEVNVEKDINSVLTDFTEAERHGVITTLKLFTLYELRAGDYWSDRYTKIFKRPEFKAWGAAASMVEHCVHRKFYNKINELLHLNTDEFYTDYVKDETLKARMEFVESVASSKNDLISLSGFCLIEGAVLYSSFSYLKHFQSNGKNKLPNLVRGIDYSVRDEDLHSLVGAWSFKALKSQLKLKAVHEDALLDDIVEMANVIYEHEARIIDMVIEKGEPENYRGEDGKNFVKSRINLCMNRLGYDDIFVVESNPIADYFYRGIKNYGFNDAFVGMSNEYHRAWDESKFTIKGKYKNAN
jgi:ribonucleotide reductase beta subunit family protein with ferritin-like domain